MKIYDVIVVGAGPGGMSAAVYAKRANLETLMIEKGAPGGNMLNTAEIENYIGVGLVKGYELSTKMFDQTQELGVEYTYGNVVDIELDNDIKIIKTDNGEYRTKTVILAPGTKARTLNADNEDKFSGKGVSYCAICDGLFFKGKDIIVVGGGNSALEEALYLSNIANSVKLIHRNSNLRADNKYIDLVIANDNISMLLDRTVESFLGGNSVEAIKLKTTDGNIEFIEAQGAFIFIGQTANTKFLTELNVKYPNLLNEGGFINVNNNMETNIPGIYGIGDVIGRNTRQIVISASDGSISAINAAKYIETLNIKEED